MLEPQKSVDTFVAEHLSSHDVYFIFGSRLARKGQDFEAQTEDHATAAFVRLSQAISDQASKLWEDANWSVSHDFLPRSQELFVGPQTMVRTLSALGRRVANSGSLNDSASGTTLLLKLRHKAKSKTDFGLNSLPICIHALSIIHFASGIKLAVLRLRYLLDANWILAQAAQIILDCNHYLGHPLTHHSDSLSWNAAPSRDSPRLMGLLRALMLTEGYEPDAPAFQRVFVFTAMTTTAAAIDSPEYDLLLSRLARKHTIGYPPGDKYSQAFGMLKNVRFSVMREGAALLVSAASGSEFSVGYLRHSVPRVYLPAVLMSIHEQALLRRMDDAIARMPSQEGYARLTALRNARHAMLQFRLKYRLESISGIAMHNEFHSLLRTALYLDNSLDHLTDDVHLVEQQLQADLHDRDDKKRRWLTALGSSAAAFAVLHEFFEIGIKLKWDHPIAISLAHFFVDKTHLPYYEYLMSQRNLDEVWGIGVPIFFALLAGGISWWKNWTFPGH